MSLPLAYCGLSCETCAIRLATLEPDQSVKSGMRTRIAEELIKIYGIPASPETIGNCDGCKSNTGRLFTGCTDCPVRLCASGKKLENCAFCNEFPCEVLERHYAFDPSSKEHLFDIRRKIES